MPLNVFERSRLASMLNVYNAIIFAAVSGAHVINLSFGGHMGRDTRCRLTEKAVDYAISLNVIVVTSAGNSNAYVKHYSPAYYSRLITVAATDSRDNKAYFSNYGNGVDIAATGVDIRSPIPGGGYANYNGISMASPYVAACVVLLKSTNNTLSPNDILTILIDNADVVGSPIYYGAGIINIVSIVSSSVRNPVASISLNKNNISLYVASTERLAATIRPNNATNPSVEWRSRSHSDK